MESFQSKQLSRAALRLRDHAAQASRKILALDFYSALCNVNTVDNEAVLKFPERITVTLRNS